MSLKFDFSKSLKPAHVFVSHPVITRRLICLSDWGLAGVKCAFE